MQFISKIVFALFAALMIGSAGIANAACNWVTLNNCNEGSESSLKVSPKMSSSFLGSGNDLFAPADYIYIGSIKMENQIFSKENKIIIGVKVIADTNGKNIDNLVESISAYSGGEKVGSAVFKNNTANIVIFDDALQTGTVRIMDFSFDGVSEEMSGTLLDLNIRIANVGLESKEINLTPSFNLQRAERIPSSKGTYLFKKVVLEMKLNDYSPAGLVGRGVDKPYFIFDVRSLDQGECVNMKSIKFFSLSGFPHFSNQQDFRLSDLNTGQVIARNALIDQDKGTIEFNVQGLKICEEVTMSLDINTMQWPANTFIKLGLKSVEAEEGIGGQSFISGDYKLYYTIQIDGYLTSIGR